MEIQLFLVLLIFVSAFAFFANAQNEENFSPQLLYDAEDNGINILLKL